MQLDYGIFRVLTTLNMRVDFDPWRLQNNLLNIFLGVF